MITAVYGKPEYRVRKQKSVDRPNRPWNAGDREATGETHLPLHKRPDEDHTFPSAKAVLL
jgi:hypothetical protein